MPRHDATSCGGPLCRHVKNRERTTLVLLRQEPIVHEVGIDHHGYRRSAKEERGCGQSIVSQPGDYIVDVLHDVLFRTIAYERAHVLGEVSSAQLRRHTRMAFCSQQTLICATAHSGWCDLDRAIDVTL
jgi:hypothetical protein